ncbi:MAG: Lrp/AsnC family transcriptional regulator [Rhodospirillales bacterium]
MLALDDRDLKILSILQTDGRVTKTELARRVNLSATPCWERLKRLEDNGIIEGYGARISLSAFGPLSVIFMEAELASHRAEDFKQFEDAILTYDDVVECWAVGGGIDYLLKFACADVDAYQRRVDGMLEADIGLRRYFTYVVTKPVKTSPLPPVPARLPAD